MFMSECAKSWDVLMDMETATIEMSGYFEDSYLSPNTDIR